MSDPGVLGLGTHQPGRWLLSCPPPGPQALGARADGTLGSSQLPPQGEQSTQWQPQQGRGYVIYGGPLLG